MSEITDDLPHPIWILAGMITVAIVMNYIFLEFVQPLLISIDPIFNSSASGYPGRYPDSPAQIVLYLFLLFSMAMYYALLVIVFHEETTASSFISGALYFLYILAILLPAGIIKTNILPAIGIDRWKPEQESSDEKEQ